MKKKVYSEEKISYARIIAFKLIWLQIYFAICFEIFLLFYTTLYLYNNNLNLWFTKDNIFNKPLFTTIFINIVWVILVIVPSGISSYFSKIVLTSPKYIKKYWVIVLLSFPFGTIFAGPLLFVFQIRKNEQFTSMTTGFLKEALDVRGFLGHIFDIIFPGTHKSHSIHEHSGEKKYLHKKSKAVIKLDYIFMLAVIFQTKSPIVIDAPIKEEENESFIETKENVNLANFKTKHMIKKLKKELNNVSNEKGEKVFDKLDHDSSHDALANHLGVSKQELKTLKKQRKQEEKIKKLDNKNKI